MQLCNWRSKYQRYLRKYFVFLGWTLKNKTAKTDGGFSRSSKVIYFAQVQVAFANNFSIPTLERNNTEPLRAWVPKFLLPARNWQVRKNKLNSIYSRLKICPRRKVRACIRQLSRSWLGPNRNYKSGPCAILAYQILRRECVSLTRHETKSDKCVVNIEQTIFLEFIHRPKLERCGEQQLLNDLPQAKNSRMNIPSPLGENRSPHEHYLAKRRPEVRREFNVRRHSTLLLF